MGCRELEIRDYFHFVEAPKKSHARAPASSCTPKNAYSGFSHTVIPIFRYYSPELGRWVKRDDIAETGGFNLYGMVSNNTIQLVDINGLAKCTEKTLSKWSVGQQAFSWSREYRAPSVGWTAGGGMSFKGSISYEEEKKCCSDCSVVTDKIISGNLSLTVDFWIGLVAAASPKNLTLFGYQADYFIGARAGVKANLGNIVIAGATDKCNGDNDYAFEFDVGYTVAGYVTGEAKASLKAGWFSFEIGADVTGTIKLPISMKGRCDESGCKSKGSTFGTPSWDVSATFCFGHCVTWQLWGGKL